MREEMFLQLVLYVNRSYFQIIIIKYRRRDCPNDAAAHADRQMRVISVQSSDFCRMDTIDNLNSMDNNYYVQAKFLRRQIGERKGSE